MSLKLEDNNAFTVGKLISIKLATLSLKEIRSFERKKECKITIQPDGGTNNSYSYKNTKSSCWKISYFTRKFS